MAAEVGMQRQGEKRGMSVSTREGSVEKGEKGEQEEGMKNEL